MTRSAGSPGLSEEDLRKRLAALRAAGRAFARALPEDEPVLGRNLAALEVGFAELRATAARAQPAADTAEGAASGAQASDAREGLATGITKVGRAICTGLDRLALADLRARFSDVSGAARADVLALLDLVLEDEARLAERIELADLLVTQLATEVQGGRRRIARDPSALTPALRTLSARMAERSDLEPASLERELVAAAQRIQQEPLTDVLTEIRDRKARMGLGLFAPAVLRALVFYNAAVWNHIRETTRPAPQQRPAPTERTSPATEGTGDGAGTSSPRTPEPASPPSAWAGRPRAADPPPPVARWKVTPELAKPAPRPEPERSSPRRPPLAYARAAAACVLVAAAAWVWLGDPPGTVRVFGGNELESVSPWLASGYRSGLGAGPFFVGRLTPDWAKQGDTKRNSAVEEITARLADSGVTELILYDDRRRTVARVGNGSPLQLIN